jgi:hypothetical protein
MVLGLLLCCFLASCNASSTTSMSDNDNLPVIPIIDLALWTRTTLKNSNSTPNDSKRKVVRQIHEACQSIGFFLIINHGLDSQVLESVNNATRDFFELASEEKLQHKTTNQAEYPYGYEQSETLVKGKQLDHGGAQNNKNLEEEEETAAAADLKETLPEQELGGGGGNCCCRRSERDLTRTWRRRRTRKLLLLPI